MEEIQFLFNRGVNRGSEWLSNLTPRSQNHKEVELGLELRSDSAATILITVSSLRM